MTKFCYPCLWQSHHMNTEGQRGQGTLAILNKYILHENGNSLVPVQKDLGRHAAHGRHSLPANAVQYTIITAHVWLICKQTAVSFWMCKSLGCWASHHHKNTENTCPFKRFSHLRLDQLYSTAQYRIISIIKHNPIIDWFISRVFSKLRALGAQHTHSPRLKTRLSIYACPCRLPMISLKPVSLFLLFQPV